MMNGERTDLDDPLGDGREPTKHTSVYVEEDRRPATPRGAKYVASL